SRLASSLVGRLESKSATHASSKHVAPTQPASGHEGGGAKRSSLGSLAQADPKRNVTTSQPGRIRFTASVYGRTARSVSATFRQRAPPHDIAAPWTSQVVAMQQMPLLQAASPMHRSL